MRRVCWDKRLVHQLFTTEADTKLTRESFLRLHQPFEKIRVLSAKPYVFPAEHIEVDGDERFVSEDLLLQAFSPTDLTTPNRIFVLTGEPGSGKSHLARWLYHQLQEQPDRFPIHIPRRINSLVALLRQLVDVAGLHLEEEPSSYLLDAPPAKVLRYLMAYLDMAVGAGSAPLLANMLLRPEFETALARQVAAYQAERQSGHPGEADLIMLPEEEFGRMAPGGTLSERVEAYATLRRHLTDALRKLSNLDRLDLKGELERISRQLVATGQRPVLILEDITSFDLLHDDLLTFLLDESAGHFDALICWTTGYEKAYLRTYQLDRYTARLSLSDSDMTVYSLQGDGFKRLVKGYLDVVKPWCKRGVCDLYDRCMPAFEGLYPFNPAALERIYDNLLGSDLQQRRTPRNLLDRAIKSYLELAEGDRLYPPLTQPPVVKEILYPEELFRWRDSHPAFVALAGWYGRQEGNQLLLDPAIPQLLGVAVPDEFQKGEQVVVPLGVTAKGEETASAPELATLTTIYSQVDASRRVEATNRLKELRLEVQSWLTSLRVPPHDHELTRAMHKLFGLFKLRLPAPLGHEEGHLAGVTYGKQQGEANLTLAGTRGKLSPSLQLILETTDPDASGREETIWLAALEYHLVGKLAPDTDLAFLAAWAQKKHALYRRAIQDQLTEVLGMDLADWVLAARRLVILCHSGISDPTYVQLVGAEDLRPLPGDLGIQGLDSALLQQVDQQVRQLFEATFTVALGVYDAPRILARLGVTDTEKAVRSLAEVAHTKVDGDFRIGITAMFRDLVRSVKQVAAAVLQMDLPMLEERAKAELGQVVAITAHPPQELTRRIDQLRRLIGLTEQYELYEPESGQTWDASHALLPHMAVQRGEIAAMQAQSVNTPSCYLSLARQVAALRMEPGYLAALAAARLTEHLGAQLMLPPESGLLNALDAGIERLRRQVRSSRTTLEQALTVLEEAGHGHAPEVRQALRVLRERLLA